MARELLNRGRVHYSKAIPLLGIVSISCGSKVIFDSSSGGASSAGVTSTTSATNATNATSTVASSASGNIDECEKLGLPLKYALAAATACDPQLQVVQCSGSEILDNDCGCPSYVLNEAQPAKVMAVKNLYDAYMKAGCGTCDPTSPCMPVKAGACELESPGATVWICKGVTPSG
jgi:hypothetical protein